MRGRPGADNRAVTEPEDEAAGQPLSGEWRTSPTTGELEYFDGLAWVRSGPVSGGSEVFIRPVPPAEQSPADAGGVTGTDCA